MRRGTTPTIVLTIAPTYDVLYATDIWVTFDQQASGTEITREWKRYPDEEDEDANRGIMVNGQDIVVTLSQEETLQFVKGQCQVQVKFKRDDYEEETFYDNVTGTVIKKIKVDDILNEEVM